MLSLRFMDHTLSQDECLWTERKQRSCTIFVSPAWELRS